MFDPDIPADHVDLTGAMFRDQFNGLKALSDTVPAGPPGENGTSVTGAVIDGTNTLNPGEPATAQTSFKARISHTLFEDPYRLIRRDM
ncbi:MAG: hypothetical protein LW645_11255 [Verrucomicrobiaceae bacterium]|nr:hypothetical protein [Verrucomicrobiaceae bacterium]